MRHAIVPMFTVLLFLAPNSQAQNSLDREGEIHKNVKLIEAAIPPDIPDEIAGQYRNFIPILKEALRDNTKDHEDEQMLLIRVAPGIKEVGAAKVKRPQARVKAFLRNSSKEYAADFILYSYITSGPVSKEETERFLIKQILEPLDCYAPNKSADSAAKASRQAAPRPVEIVDYIPPKPAPSPAESRPTESASASPDKSGAIEIHRNVKIIEGAPGSDLPADIAGQYRSFMQIFKEALRDNTKDQADESSLLIRVAAGMREVGASKSKRAQVRISALSKNSPEEYVSDFSLYSYATSGIVSREETEQFLIKQILQPLECYAPGRSVAAAAKPESEIASPATPPVVTSEIKPAPESRIAESVAPPKQKFQQETEIHKNIRLLEMALAPDLPADVITQYQNFLPMLKEVLKENTQDQADDIDLIIRVTAGVREVGAAKVKRPQARIAGYLRNSRQEYVGNFLLYSYETNGPVSKSETERFLIKQILQPLECYAPDKTGMSK
jgi:hypothetical protein